MKIGAALEFNLIDYPGRIAAVAFTPGCNYRCPHCHAKPLVDGGMPPVNEEDFFDYLATVKDWVNGVTVCGGEPTLQPDLIAFMKEIKARGLQVKLDTNGSSPEVLSRLLSDKLVDYVAMDVKGPERLWAATAGVTGYAERIKESVRLAAAFPEYEFRTTVSPVVRDAGISFLTVTEMKETAELIAGNTGSRYHRYFVQKFVPRKNGLLDPGLESFPETPPQLLRDIHAEVVKILPKTEVRG